MSLNKETKPIFYYDSIKLMSNRTNEVLMIFFHVNMGVSIMKGLMKSNNNKPNNKTRELSFLKFKLSET